MKEIILQRKGKSLHPFSQEDLNKIKSYHENQPIKARLTGSRKARSLQQNKWIHAIFRIVADNIEDDEWNTPEKAKRSTKLAMKFFKDDVVVDGNKVYFELRSFAFDRMDQDEADIKYNEAKVICAKKIGVSPESLEANAKEQSW